MAISQPELRIEKGCFGEEGYLTDRNGREYFEVVTQRSFVLLLLRRQRTQRLSITWKCFPGLA